MVKIIAGIFVVGALAVGWFVLQAMGQDTPPSTIVSTVSPTIEPSPSSTPTPTAPPTAVVPVIHRVPFTAQAPTANWGDALYQNACEEASILMARAFILGEDITPESALEDIRLLADRADVLFGSHLDESAQDTASLARDAMPGTYITLIEDAGVDDIMRAVASGNIVLVPLNGKLLGNLHYKPPGPLRHMLVVTGYDPLLKEFITNDPGTRFGEGYRYSQDVLFSAMHDWDTGDNTQVYPDRKVIITVGPR